MFEGKKITFIGSGNMALGMMRGLLRNGLVTADQIIATDIYPKRLDEINSILSVTTSIDNSTAVQNCDIVILSIKPQSLADVAHVISEPLPAECLVLSILAGTPLATLTTALQHDRVVRAMPNTPAQVGQAMTVWTTTAAVSETQRAQSQAIFAAFGREIFTEKESQLDMATAINGSGPGYVFLILEAMIDAGVHLGFSRPVAELLVMQTVLGSVEYALASEAHLAELRNQVTSPGGTTAAGLAAMERAGLRTALAEGIWAAYQRSVDLGR